MNATFRQLRLFLALAECGSITGAAKACHVTQPTVSMQLRELADAVGLPLYEQIGKRLHLTAAGEALAETARTMLDEWISFEQAINAMKGLEQGRLRVALVSTAKYFVPRLLGKFCTEHPNIEITLEILNRDGVVARLRENRDDLYIMSQPPENLDLEQHAFLDNPLVLIAPEGHRLKGSHLELKDLQEERFILRERGSGTRLACDAYFARSTFVPAVRLELGSNEAIKQAVVAGLGISFISQHTLGLELSAGRLVVLPVEGMPVMRRWFLVRHKSKRLTPALGAFWDFVLEFAPDYLKRLEHQAAGDK